MRQQLVIREFFSEPQRPNKTSVLASGPLIVMTLLLVGCGSSDDSSGSGCNAILAIFTAGLSCIAETFGVPVSTGSGSSSPITTTPPPPPEPPTTPPPPVESAEFSFRILSEAFDVEPNDSILTASVASFPIPQVPEQSVGFLVNGTINTLTDGVDTYAFTAARSRTFEFHLCGRTVTNGCGDGILDVAIASFSVLDQYGTVLLSSQGNTGIGNGQQLMRIDAGVLYYVMVIAEDTVNEEQKYSLRVYEAIPQPEQEMPQDSDTTPPVLASPAAPPVGLLVTLDWIPPTMNVNGTPLLDLAGYNVYFGPEPGMYLDFRHLDNPGLVTYVLDLPSSGSWFIVITALDSAGDESDFSNEVVVDVLCECDLPPPPWDMP